MGVTAALRYAVNYVILDKCATANSFLAYGYGCLPPPHTLIEIFALWNWVESRLSLCWVFYGWSQDGIVGNQGESREKRD